MSFNHVSKKFFLLGLTLALSSTAWSKKTICSITINSDDEIRAMREVLPLNEYNFVELVKPGQHDWFKQACASGVKCDALVVSGHFAGTFFGDSGMQLTLKELEESSCDKKCDGIYKNVKDVYLFGCNTLAGKEKDHRTPEQYLRVLLGDGFSMAHAQQAVAFRYSMIGSAFYSRMANTFSKSPRIYGFYSTSPLGKVSGPRFKKFLVNRSGQGQYANELDSLSTEKNTDLMRSFSGTSITQISGNRINDNSLTPVCYLSSHNKSTSRVEKLNWIKESFERSSSLDLINYISHFLKDQANSRRWSSEEKEILHQIVENQTLKTQLTDIVNSNQTWMKKTVLEISEFMRAIGWISESEYDNKVIELLELYKSNFGRIESEFACASSISADLKSFNTSKVNWDNQYLKYGLMCLNPKNNQINQRLYNYNN